MNPQEGLSRLKAARVCDCVCVCVCVCVYIYIYIYIYIEIGGGGCTLKARLNDKVVGLTKRNKTQRNNDVLCALLTVRSYLL